MTNAAQITLSQGKRIRYAREAAGLKQQELADLLRVSRSALSAWEDDKNRRGVPYNDLRAIAEHTGFDVEFFQEREATFTRAATGRYSRRFAALVGNLQVSGFRHPAATTRAFAM